MDPVLGLGVRPRRRAIRPLVPGAELNVSANCPDRHVAAERGGQPALIWDSAMENRVEVLTHAQLLDRTARVAGALAALHVGRGDRLVAGLPKTRSGKILRALLRRLAEGQAAAPPPTIDDPAILDEIAKVLSR